MVMTTRRIAHAFYFGFVAASFFLFLRSSPEAAQVRKVVGQLGLVEGKVFLDSEMVRKNAPVREGSVIETKKGRASLILGEGSVFYLGADSKLVVDRYVAKTLEKNEGAELDLKFGRTRALIFNQGNEKKEIKIKARAATMGVRGTEIFIVVPKDSSKPIQFFTLEGKAEVVAHPGAPVTPVGQNEGVTATGNVQPAGGGSASGSGGASNSGAAQISTLTVSEIKSEIKKAGLEGGSTLVPQVPSAPPDLQVSVLPPIRFDPVQDRPDRPLVIHPHFCNANAAGACSN